ncbi:hypothetical protein NG895_12330 [Aeoliella sp. ICT_H6.2]|uniref:Uncharacterized protein n=1 Tax=Aeoliella straminimaris TaxID=2954799 RepID=A0A9X2JGG2_9BACT|nr:hypothetical protein [Aeoliella straminimaris]MCO6044696.1 hypothetical protein [Aeoliella straminimaris]
MANRSIEAGRAFMRLFVDDNELRRGLDKAAKQMRAFGQSIAKVGAGFTALGATIVAPLTAAVKIFQSTGDALDKMSQRTGVSVEALSEIGFAAEQSGKDLAVFEKAFIGQARSIRNLERGLSTSAEAYDALGLSIEDLQGLAPDEQFALIARRLAGIEDPTRKAALAMEVFGRAGSQLVPLLGSLDGLRQQARDLGLTIDTETAQSAAELTDAFNEVRRVVLRTAVAIGAELAEPLIKAARWIRDTAKASIAWAKENGGLIRSVAAVGAGLVAVGVTLATVGAGFIAAGAAVTGFTVVVNALNVSLVFLAANPLVALVAAIGAVVVGLGLWVAATKESTAANRDSIKSVQDLAGELNAARSEFANAGDEVDIFRAKLAAFQGGQQLTGQQLVAQAKIVRELQDAFGDLGIVYDRTTGAIANLDEALTKLAASEKKAAATKAYEDSLDQVNAEALKAANRMRELQQQVEGLESNGFGLQFRSAGVLTAKSQLEEVAKVYEDLVTRRDELKLQFDADIRAIDQASSRTLEITAEQAGAVANQAGQSIAAGIEQAFGVGIPAVSSAIESLGAAAQRSAEAIQREKELREQQRLSSLRLSDELAALKIATTQDGLAERKSLIDLQTQQDRRDLKGEGLLTPEIEAALKQRGELLKQQAEQDFERFNKKPKNDLAAAESRGTFSGRAASLGALNNAGSIDKEQLEELKKLVDEAGRTRRAIQNGKGVPVT